MKQRKETSVIPAGTVVYVGGMPFELAADAKVQKSECLAALLEEQRNRTFTTGCDSGSVQAAH